MTSEAQGMVLGLGGLLCTLVSSALGLHFTARARTAPMREILYAKQLELAERILRNFGRARVLATLLIPEGEHRDQARKDIRVVVKRLSLLTDHAAALLPTELYVAISEATRTLTSLVVEYDESRDTRPLAQRLATEAAKASLMVRTVLGVDELSEESIRLFAKGGALERLAEIDPQDLRPVRDPAQDGSKE